jgi:hypothetical protein
MCKKILIANISACFFFLSLLVPVRAALVTGDLSTGFIPDRHWTQSVSGKLSFPSTGTHEIHQFTGETSSIAQYPNHRGRFFASDHDGSRYTKTFPVVERVSFKSGKHKFIDLGLMAPRETSNAMAMKNGKTATDKRFPGPLFPSPINEPVTLLLLGSGLILLAGFGMKKYRKLISTL